MWRNAALGLLSVLAAFALLECLLLWRPALSLRSVGIFGPVGRARAIEFVGFFALMARSWRRKLWAHELPDFVRLEVFGTL